MTKIQLKSDSITPFVGLFSIFKQFSSSGLRQTVDSHLGKRGKTDAAFTYCDIFAMSLNWTLTTSSYPQGRRMPSTHTRMLTDPFPVLRQWGISSWASRTTDDGRLTTSLGIRISQLGPGGQSRRPDSR